MLAHVTVQDD